MMNLGKADAEQMSLYEYQARMWHWNEIHTPKEKQAEVPHEVTQKIIDDLRANPEMLGPKPPGFGEAEPAKMA